MQTSREQEVQRGVPSNHVRDGLIRGDLVICACGGVGSVGLVERRGRRPTGRLAIRWLDHLEADRLLRAVGLEWSAPF